MDEVGLSDRLVRLHAPLLRAPLQHGRLPLLASSSSHLNPSPPTQQPNPRPTTTQPRVEHAPPPQGLAGLGYRG